MDYDIIKLDEFQVMGINYELSSSLNRNIHLAQRHWRTFNNKLRINKVRLGRNWLKYAFIMNNDDELCYYIAVPKKDYVPQDFEEKTISKSKYLLIKHQGNMNKLKNTMDDVYNQLIPQNDIIINSENFFYFERYDYKFHWNRSDSIIEIYLPII